MTRGDLPIRVAWAAAFRDPTQPRVPACLCSSHDDLQKGPGRIDKGGGGRHRSVSARIQKTEKARMAARVRIRALLGPLPRHPVRTRSTFDA